MGDIASAFRGTLVELLGSKKFVASVAGGLTVLLIKASGKLGWGLDPQTAGEVANALTAMVLAYVVGQGVADHGATAAEVNANKDTLTVATTQASPDGKVVTTATAGTSPAKVG